MAITIETMRQVGVNLKREAVRQQRPVDIDSLVQLYTYAHQPILQGLDEPDLRTVVETIGKQALETHGKLDLEAIITTIRGICTPTGGWDLCHKAARRILSDHGRHDAVEKIDRAHSELLKELSKDTEASATAIATLIR